MKRGRPGADESERYWNPREPPCVPSDQRPPHLLRSREAAEAASAASQVEESAFDERFDDDFWNEERYDLACVKHAHALRRLRRAFPEFSEERQTRPCPCGRGELAMWPWVAHTAQAGFCDHRACSMARWELTCWRSEWIVDGAGRRDLGL